MTRSLRAGMFFFFVVLFLVSAPVVVLYTAGYRYSLHTHRLEKTGVLFVSTIPKDAMVLLDDVPEAAASSTPAVISNLSPNDYKIRLIRDGYHPWEKILPVKSSETTYVTDAVLFAQANPASLVTDDADGFALDHSSGKTTFVIHSASWDERWIFDPATGERTLLDRASAGEVSTSAAFSMFGRYLLVTDRVYDLIDHDIVVLKDLIEGAWADATWDPREDAVLHVRTADGAIAVDVAAGRAEVLWDAPVSALRIADRTIAARSNKVRTEIFSVASREDAPLVIAYLPQGEFRFVDAHASYALLADVAHERIVLVDRTAGTEPILLNATASMWDWASDDRLLYSDGTELHVYNPATHMDELLTRLGSVITAISWFPGREVALFAHGGALDAIELDARAGRVSTPLAQDIGEISALTTVGRDAYFLAASETGTTLLTLPLQLR